MATTKGPLMSLAAKGKIGDVMVFSSWKGRSYVRGLTKGANPMSTMQIAVRSCFSFLAPQWAALTVPQKDTWINPAAADNIPKFQAYMAGGLEANRNFLTPSKVFPYDPGGPIGGISAMIATPGIRQITLHFQTTAFGVTNWGIVINRSLTTPFTPSLANQYALIPCASNSTADFVDSPLEPGTYYYDAKPFNLTGAATHYFGEVNATV